MRLRIALALTLLALPVAAMAQTTPVQGLRRNDPGLHALVGARVVVAPGRVLENATIVIRDGVIAAVGPDVQPPAGARLWRLDGATVYPGFIDAHASVGMPERLPPGEADDENEPIGPGAFHWNPQMRAHVDAAAVLGADDDRRAAMRAAGFTAALAVPQLGMFRGQAAAVSLGSGGPERSVLRRAVAQSVVLDSDNRVGGGYPNSAMGAIAFVRQVLLDADWYIRAHAAWDQNPLGLERPETNLALAALAPVVRGEQPVLFDTEDEEEALRAMRIAEEFSVRPWIRGSGYEYRLLDEVAAIGAPLILPLDFPGAPDVEDPVEALDVGLEELRHWYLAPENPGRLAGAGVEFALTADGVDAGDFLGNLGRAVDRGLGADVALAALTTIPARWLGIDRTHGTIDVGKAASLVVADGAVFDGGRIRDVWVDGERFAISERAGSSGAAAEATGNGASAPDAPAVELVDLRPAMEYGRAAPPEQPAVVLVRNGTVWTQGPQGRIENGDVLIRAGRIAEVGRNLQAPAGALVIDATGKHVTPGLIDAHLHAGVSGGVNESGHAIVPEVRIGDVLTMYNLWTYRQLAGGLTAAHVMHGSANPIGGQNQIVKMRWGSTPEALKLDGATRTVKFALGENPKRREGRYPDTRMGTEQIIRDHFQAAREYERRWQAWESGGRQGIPPRRDLRLEALVEILHEDVRVQSHSYRQDEILMLMRVAEDFGFRIQAFQHAVEAYKVAPELAAHGAAASVWSDWSSFKIEAYDATTFNARLLLDAGVLTSLHSDNSQLSSRMNWEAAKLLRTGVSEIDALSLVTNRTAALLGIEDRVGSLEAGKDADFVIWSMSPLSTFTRAEETWVDGRKYFDIDEDQQAREAVAEERAQLIELALAARSTRGEQ